MERHWIVISSQRGHARPPHEHLTRESAVVEANRLARSNPGDFFSVYEFQGRCRKTPETTWEHPALPQLLPPAEVVWPLCVCGHERRQHIYDEGSCRPGPPGCAARCGEYRPVGGMDDDDNIPF